MSTETSPTYLLPSLTARVLRGLAIPFFLLGFPLLLLLGAGLILFLIAGGLIFFAHKAVKDQVRIEDGIFFRFAGGRKIIEFDLRSIEEWFLAACTDDDGEVASAQLYLKSRFSKKRLTIHYHHNKALFTDMLTMLHKEKRNLARTNPAPYESRFRKSDPEICQILKNW